MTSDDPFLFSPLGCLPFFSLWPLMTPFSFVHWLVCPPSLYDLWWALSLCPLGCLSFSLWPLMTPFSFLHWVVCPSSLYGLWWPLSLLSIGLPAFFSSWPLMTPFSLSIGLSVLLFMTSDDPFLFCPMGCLPFFSLWPLMTPFSFVHWVVCPFSLYGLWCPI